MNLRPYKGSLIHELFLHTADENYITARWCAVNRLNTDFCWLAVHALEKYMKAVLVWNGLSSKPYGHDIERLFAEVAKIAGPLVPDRLVKPQNLNIHHWAECSMEDFVRHRLKNGNADNRYLIFGYTVMAQDLHMLDLAVYALRRLCVPLDLPVVPDESVSYTYRAALAKQPEYCPGRFGPLDRLIADPEESPARTAALNMNMAFAPEDFPHTPIPGTFAARNPSIVRLVLEPLKSDDSVEAARGYELARWLLDNIHLPGIKKDPGVKQQVEDAMAAAKERHNLQ